MFGPGGLLDSHLFADGVVPSITQAAIDAMPQVVLWARDVRDSVAAIVDDDRE